MLNTEVQNLLIFFLFYVKTHLRVALFQVFATFFFKVVTVF
jgi:hypothetical protein